MDSCNAIVARYCCIEIDPGQTMVPADPVLFSKHITCFINTSTTLPPCGFSTIILCSFGCKHAPIATRGQQQPATPTFRTATTPVLHSRYAAAYTAFSDGRSGAFAGAEVAVRRGRHRRASLFMLLALGIQMELNRCQQSGLPQRLRRFAMTVLCCWNVAL